MTNSNGRLVDIHAHVLPAVDDGPRDDAAALEMLRVAAADGIGTIVATPHSHWVRGARLPEAVARLNELARANGIEIEVLAGNEARISANLLEEHARGDILTLNGTSYLLLELYLSHDWKLEVIERVLGRLLDAGLRPILAHPERYPFVVLDPLVVERFVRLGVPLQLNAPSLSGYHSQGSQRAARALVEAGLIHLVASDAHSPAYRPPLLRDALEQIAALRGPEYAAGLRANAEAVIRGEPLNLDLGGAGAAGG
jgi:protein-tyrosine phosphatase